MPPGSGPPRVAGNPPGGAKRSQAPQDTRGVQSRAGAGAAEDEASSEAPQLLKPHKTTADRK